MIEETNLEAGNHMRLALAYAKSATYPYSAADIREYYTKVAYKQWEQGLKSIESLAELNWGAKGDMVMSYQSYCIELIAGYKKMFPNISISKKIDQVQDRQCRAQTTEEYIWDTQILDYLYEVEQAFLLTSN